MWVAKLACVHRSWMLQYVEACSPVSSYLSLNIPTVCSDIEFTHAEEIGN